MENKYWIERKRSAMAMARRASTAEARLIHYDLAGRYSIMAALSVPFIPSKMPASQGERAVLHLRQPSRSAPASRPDLRRDPDGPSGEIR